METATCQQFIEGVQASACGGLVVCAVLIGVGVVFVKEGDEARASDSRGGG